MPTGYTAAVADGTMTDLSPFVLQCARAFGATITQRDDPLSVPPAFLVVDSHYADNVIRDQKRLEQIREMTDAECEQSAHDEWVKLSTDKIDALERNEETRKRYLAMIDKVHGWIPPTNKHNRLKEFMLEQLYSGMKFDVLSDDYFTMPIRKTASAWRKEQIESAEWNLNYSKTAMEREQKRSDENNAWIAALYKSLT